MVRRVPNRVVSTNRPVVLPSNVISICLSRLLNNTRIAIRLDNLGPSYEILLRATNYKLRGQRYLEGCLVGRLLCLLVGRLSRFILLDNGLLLLLGESVPLGLPPSFDSTNLVLDSHHLGAVLGVLASLARFVVQGSISIPMYNGRLVRRELSDLRVAIHLNARGFLRGIYG